MRTHGSIILYTLPILYNTAFAQATDSPQSVANLQAYKQLRACAQNCFEYNAAGCVGDNVANHLTCPYGCFSYALDSCYCRPDLQTAAESWLSSCISTGCSGGQTTVDISSAISIYDGYCLSAGYTALRTPKAKPSAIITPTITNTPTNIITPTAEATSPQITTVVTIISPSGSTLASTTANTSASPSITSSLSSARNPPSTLTEVSTSSVSRNSQGSGGLNQGDRIALGVGIPSTIFGFLALFFTGRCWSRNRSRQRQGSTFRSQ